jgi:hypothetical protein
MFNKKRQARVEITFKHGNYGNEPPTKEVIEILPGQEFEQCIGADRLWDGKTIIKEYDWVAGFTRVYEYFYV